MGDDNKTFIIIIGMIVALFAILIISMVVLRAVELDHGIDRVAGAYSCQCCKEGECNCTCCQ